VKEKQVSKLSGQSLDIEQAHIENLKSIFPQVVKDGKVDFKALQLILGDDIASDNERYGLNWAGKMDCFRHIQEPTTATLKPIKEESVDFDNTENIFIEGDNLQVLKTLQKSYHGKIKMIYIDPPYNTGNDTFIYPDRFQESKEEYLQRIGDKDTEGNLIKDGFLRKNSKDAGHFHSNWLSMMYPRLFLAKNLLHQEGLIFVSIDDGEIHNLRMIMNELFGENNFISQLTWKKSYGGGSKVKHVVVLHEYILVYAKDKEMIDKIELPPNPEARKYYSGKDEKHDTRGPYRTQPLATNSMDARPNLRYPIIFEGEEVWPEKQWQWSRERTLKVQKENGLIISKESGKWSVRYKQYLFDENGKERGAKPFSILDGPYTQEGTAEVKNLFGNSKIFAFPKSTGIIKRFVNYIYQDRDAIILDYFAGSCTTAHAIMALNAEDGGNRKYIMIQLPEPCEEKSEAFKAGYKTIADIGKERIRRAAKKIKEEQQGKLDFGGGKLDLGFKAFKLDESSFKPWRSDITTSKQLEKQLSLFTDNVKPEALQENILYELALKTGLDLNIKVEEKKANGKKYFAIENGKLAICLEEKISKGLIEKVIKSKPEKFICLDRAFAGNDQLKTNTALQMEAEKIEFKVI